MQKRLKYLRIVTNYRVQLERVGSGIGLHYFDYQLEDETKDTWQKAGFFS